MNLLTVQLESVSLLWLSDLLLYLLRRKKHRTLPNKSNQPIKVKKKLGFYLLVILLSSLFAALILQFYFSNSQFLQIIAPQAGATEVSTCPFVCLSTYYHIM